MLAHDPGSVDLIRKEVSYAYLVLIRILTLALALRSRRVARLLRLPERVAVL